MQVTSAQPVSPYRFEDPRSPLEKLRRKELRAFCRGHGVSYSVEMSAVTLRNLIRERGLTGTEPYNVIDEKTPEVQAPDQVDELRAKFMAVGYMDLKKACKQRGIAMKRTDKKPDLVEKLIGQNTP